MRVLLIDTETTGLDPEQGAVCIEVAAMLYSVGHACAIESYAALLFLDGPNPAEHVNRICPGLCHGQGETPSVAWDRVSALAGRADAIVAHRAEFDRKFVPEIGNMKGKPWICTKTDVDWPGGHRGDHLVHLALAYGLGVASAHRAMTDVDTIARILTRVAETASLKDLLHRAMRPKRRFVALVSYDQRALAKNAGFFWDEKRREWYRVMPPEDAGLLAFRTEDRP
jgi:DNA polymerase-3 subunit epsilon